MSRNGAREGVFHGCVGSLMFATGVALGRSQACAALSKARGLDEDNAREGGGE